MNEDLKIRKVYIQQRWFVIDESVISNNDKELQY